MSDGKPTCRGNVYRGIVILTIQADDERRTVVVVGAANRQAVRLYECESYTEACALVDAALALTAGPVLPVRRAGGPRGDWGGWDGSIQTA